MKKFDITFRGEVLPRHDPEEVKAGFVDLFKIRDSGMLEEIFSGETVVLRSNLDRKAAAEYFVKVNELGAVIELVTSNARYKDHENASANLDDGEDFAPHIVDESGDRISVNGDIQLKQPGLVDRSWPVSTAHARQPKPEVESKSGRANGHNVTHLKIHRAQKEDTAKREADAEKELAATRDAEDTIAAAAEKNRLAGLEHARQMQERAAKAKLQAEEATRAELHAAETAKAKRKSEAERARRLQETEAKARALVEEERRQTKETARRKTLAKQIDEVTREELSRLQAQGLEVQKNVETRLTELQQAAVQTGTAAEGEIARLKELALDVGDNDG